jgi:hypothetical protein
MLLPWLRKPHQPDLLAYATRATNLATMYATAPPKTRVVVVAGVAEVDSEAEVVVVVVAVATKATAHRQMWL